LYVRGLLLDGSASRYSRWRTGWGSIISGCSRSWALRQLAAEFPADTPLQDLIRLGKIRWRIEHDYRELKTGLGLDDYEGRTWKGWHRHVTSPSWPPSTWFLTTLHLTSPKATGAA
jgi:SRSO17 transposase